MMDGCECEACYPSVRSLSCHLQGKRVFFSLENRPFLTERRASGKGQRWALVSQGTQTGHLDDVALILYPPTNAWHPDRWVLYRNTASWCVCVNFSLSMAGAVVGLG